MDTKRQVIILFADTNIQLFFKVHNFVNLEKLLINSRLFYAKQNISF